MRSSERRGGGADRLAIAVAVALACSAWATRADAQQATQGYAVERLYPSAPGGGWFVMDDLAMRGGLGGAIALTGGTAHGPVRLATADRSQRLTLVSDQAFAALGVAATYERFRLYLDLTRPLLVTGESGAVGAYRFTGPSNDAGKTPDLLSDVRVGLDTRLLGDADGPFRLGLGLQLFFPSGERADYVTDDTYRGMVRALFAGDVGVFRYAGHVGAHIRPVDDSPAPGPQGSELLFGVAGGPALSVGSNTALVVGPEIFGETAFQSLFDANRTGLEGLVTGRLEGTAAHGPQLRLKLGAGGGLSAHFGAPEWRAVFGLEVFDRTRGEGETSCPDDGRP